MPPVSVRSVSRGVAFAAGVAAMSAASAVPITYEGSLTPGVTVGGSIRDPALTGTPNDDFWSFTGTEGQVITLVGHRLDAGLDLAFYVYRGTGTDTGQLGQEIAIADDEIPALPGLDGPFADPRLLNFSLPTTGAYTVQVWDFLSTDVPDGTDRPYQLTLDISTVPEPGGLPLLGIAALGWYGLIRRRRDRS